MDKEQDFFVNSNARIKARKVRLFKARIQFFHSKQCLPILSFINPFFSFFILKSLPLADTDV